MPLLPFLCSCCFIKPCRLAPYTHFELLAVMWCLLSTRHFIPALKTFPAKYIYEPWKAPMADQKKANCIIGKVCHCHFRMHAPQVKQPAGVPIHPLLAGTADAPAHMLCT